MLTYVRLRDSPSSELRQNDAVADDHPHGSQHEVPVHDENPPARERDVTCELSTAHEQRRELRRRQGVDAESRDGLAHAQSRLLDAGNCDAEDDVERNESRERGDDVDAFDVFWSLVFACVEKKNMVYEIFI